MATHPLTTTTRRHRAPIAAPTLREQQLVVCPHPTTGNVAWPRPASTTTWGAAIACCARPGCVQAAHAWVEARTGHRGVHAERFVPADHEQAVAHLQQLASTYVCRRRERVAA